MRALSIVTTGIILACSPVCGPALAGDDEIYGTWKLVSEQTKYLDTGEIVDLTGGAAPSGYITYGRDGRMMALLVRGVRPKPDSLSMLTDQQRADLFRSMASYAGTYKFD